MKYKYASNFVSFEPKFVDSLDHYISTENNSRAALDEIRTEIRIAAEYFRQAKYVQAIASYTKAKALLYKLITPEQKIDSILINPKVLHQAVTPATENLFAEIGLRLIENFQPQIQPRKPAVTLENGPRTDTFKTGFSLPNNSRFEVSKATELISNGYPDLAVPILKEALKATSDEETTMTARLNLGSALLAAGNYTEAATESVKVAETFRVKGDLLGEAQGLHNAAVAYKNMGDTAKATEMFNKAKESFESIESKRATPSGNTEPGPGRRSPSITNPTLLTDRSTTTDIRVPVTSAVTIQPESFAKTLRPTTNLTTLNFIKEKNEDKISFRFPGEDVSWQVSDVKTLGQPTALRQDWQYVLPIGKDSAVFDWKEDKRPEVKNVITQLYEKRLTTTDINSLRPSYEDQASTAFYLNHLYSFVIPQSLGNCYKEVGDYAKAQEQYVLAAGYPYINKQLEAPILWSKMAKNILAWGDAYYKNENLEKAVEVYSSVVTKDYKVPTTSVLYQTPGLADASAHAVQVIAAMNGNQFGDFDPGIAEPIYIVSQRFEYINANLDFYGLSFTPILTFEYLQNVARGFAQQSIQAEREYVNFKVQSEAEQASRRELQNALSLANAEVNIQQQNYQASSEDLIAMQNSKKLAELRLSNAKEDRNLYQSAGYWQYVSQSIATAHGAGQDWHGSEIRELARDIENGKWKGNAGKLAAAATLLGGQKSYEYQLARLDNVVEEMNAVIPIAEAQARAAEHRQRAAQLSYEASKLRKNLLQNSLEAFENEAFTPEVWARMANCMREISSSYQFWAIRTAKLMERSYNFEMDTNLFLIKNEYSASSTDGLLGSDLLLRDIDSFTYQYITTASDKENFLKDVVSLRNEFPFNFYQFQETGTMTFDTRLTDFDSRHPGFCCQRIHCVEIEVVGLLPSSGINGTLRGSFVSKYRSTDGSERTRLHSIDTKALSEYEMRGDVFVFKADERKRNLFEGNGVAGTWQLELPLRSNNFDYRLISDVRIVFYYSALFNDQLKQKTLQAAPLPGEMIHVRDFAMRYDFPEVWYGLLNTRNAAFELTPDYFPRNEKNLKIDKVAFRVLTSQGVDAKGIKLTVKLPNGVTDEGVTDATGTWPAAKGKESAALGPWNVAIEIPNNSAVLKENKIDARKLLDIAIVVQYAFDWK